MALTDILRNLRDYFSRSDSREQDAALDAADAAIQAGNLVTGGVTPTQPSVYAPQAPQIDPNNVQITEIPQVQPVDFANNPALAAADAAIKAGQQATAGTNTNPAFDLASNTAQNVVQTPQVPIVPVAQTPIQINTPPPTTISPAPVAPINIGAGTQQDLVEADVPTPFILPEILPDTGFELPKKTTAWEEIVNLAGDLGNAFMIGGNWVNRNLHPFSLSPEGSFGLPDRNSVFTYGQIYDKIKQAQTDPIQQSEVLNNALKDLGYTGPAKTPQQYVEFYSKLLDTQRSPINVKDQVTVKAERFGVDIPTTKAITSQLNDFRAKEVTILEKQLFELGDKSDQIDSDIELASRIDQVKSMYEAGVSFWNESLSAIKLTKERALLEGRDVTQTSQYEAQAEQLRTAYSERYRQLILWAQEGALASGKQSEDAKAEADRYVARKLKESGSTSITDYMNRDLPIVREDLSPDSNMQLLAASAGLSTYGGLQDVIKNGKGDYIYQNLQRIGIWANDAWKTTQKMQAEAFVEWNGNLLGAGVDFEGAADRPLTRQILTKEGIGSVSRGVNALLENGPEIAQTILSISAASATSSSMISSYTVGANKATQIGKFMRNGLAENLLPNIIVNNIANASQPYITPGLGVANEVANVVLDPQVIGLPFQVMGGVFNKTRLGAFVQPRILATTERLGEEGFKQVASSRKAWQELLKSEDFVKLSEAEQLLQVDQLARKLTPTISPEELKAVSTYSKKLENGIFEAAKRDPVWANQFAKNTMVQGELSKGIKEILGNSGGLTDDAKLKIADLQNYLNKFAGDQAVNVADMIRQIYGIEAPVFYGGFYSGLAKASDLVKAPDIATSNIQYIIPAKVYDAVGSSKFDPNNVTVDLVERLKIVYPDSALVSKPDGTFALDEATLNGLGIVETKQFAQSVPVTGTAENIVDDLIEKNILDEASREGAIQNATMVDRVLSKILCP